MKQVSDSRKIASQKDIKREKTRRTLHDAHRCLHACASRRSSCPLRESGLQLVVLGSRVRSPAAGQSRFPRSFAHLYAVSSMLPAISCSHLTSEAANAFLQPLLSELKRVLQRLSVTADAATRFVCDSRRPSSVLKLLRVLRKAGSSGVKGLAHD